MSADGHGMPSRPAGDMRFGDFDTTYYNRIGAEEFAARLSNGAILAQGPVGSVLLSQPDGADIPPAFWNLAEQQTVANIHQLYVVAGAQLLITNTFQASAPALERDGILPDVREVNRAAVDAARAARPQLLAGSMGPCGLAWVREDSPEYRAARAAYREQAHALLAAGVDALLLETFASIRDLEPALAGALDVASGMPVLVSFAIGEAGNLLGDGLTIEGAVVWAERRGAAAVGVNCCSLAAADAAVPRMAASARTPVMVRPNAGEPCRSEDGALRWDEDPDASAASCVSWVRSGARVVGACCGATARTCAAQAEVLDRAGLFDPR